jgi:hypothetical protein
MKSTKARSALRLDLPNQDGLVRRSIFYFHIYTLNGGKEGAEGE